MATGKNLPGTIRVTSDGNFKVLTPNNKWVGADTMREAMDAMKNAWGPNVGPRVLPPKRGMKSGGTVSRKEVGGQVRRPRKSPILPKKPKAKKAPKVPVGAGMDFPASKRNIFYDLEWDNKAGTWYSIPKKIDKRTGIWKRIGSGKKPSTPWTPPKGKGLPQSEEYRNKGPSSSQAYSGPKIKRGGKVSRKKGGTVSRKRGSKIMQGYKAGGRV